MEGREVIIHEYVTVKNKVSFGKVAIGEGIFRAFGCDYETLEDGVGNFSTAIIEMPDGKLKNIPVELIVMKTAKKVKDKPKTLIPEHKPPSEEGIWAR